MDNKAAYLNAEVRPFANAFYVAAGVAYLDNDYGLEQRGNTIRLNGNDFAAAAGEQGYVKGKMNYEGFAPYLGLGFSPAITSRVGLFGEIGAYYTGNPTVNLEASNNLTPAGTSTQTIDQAIEEQENKLRNDSKYEFLPVAKLGLSVRF